MYIYIYIYRGCPGPGHSGTYGNEIPGHGGTFFDFGGLFIKKKAQSSASCDGPRQAASNTAIESFWRCLFAKYDRFCDP